MPISLLRNSKTVHYLHGMFAILDGEKNTGVEYKSLQKKVTAWLAAESKRLDLNENESALLEQCSNIAYDIVNTKPNVTAAEKAFIDQHEFFFKN